MEHTIYISTIVLAGLAIYHIGYFTIRFWAIGKQKRNVLLFNRYLYKWGLVATIAILVWINIDLVNTLLPKTVADVLDHVVLITAIISCSYLLSRILAFSRAMLLDYYDHSHADNLHSRKIHTQFRVLERIFNFIIIIGALAFILMSFEPIRHLGATILASAGVIGIILGFAAQKSISTIIAGVQIAISQPIRIDDVVIVEGEWGRIEEITLTYVVVNIWDKRKLILPINYFIEKPFQNWTRTTSELIGTVFIYVDYTVPVEAIRNELNRLLAQSPLWDGKHQAVQVTNVTDRSIEIRLLVSAADASKAFDLRCEVRENMIHFLQKNYPDALPKQRWMQA